MMSGIISTPIEAVAFIIGLIGFGILIDGVLGAWFDQLAIGSILVGVALYLL